MSSHHVIRENQEFALIIADGQSCSLKLMNELLGWSPLVIVLDGAFPRVDQLGIKIDVWLGDFDKSPDREKTAQSQQPIEIVHTPDQDKTDFEKGILYCLEKGFKNITVIWATGHRMDHTIANITNLVKYRLRANLTMLDNHSHIYPLPNQFEKWFPAGQNISLVPVPEAGGIFTEGLEYPIKGGSLKLGERIGTSNRTTHDGPVNISYNTGHLLLMECHD